jgi:predicted O-methyltransferase YrrM
MTAFLAPEADFGPLYRIIDESLYAPVLVTAVNLEIFDRVSSPVSARELAGQVGWHPKNTEFFLNALTAVQLLEKRNGKYQNTALSRTYLLSGSKMYLGDMLVHSFAMCSQTPQTLGTLIQGGPQAMSTEAGNMGHDHDMEAMAEKGVDYTARIQLTYAHLVASIVSDLPEFPGMKRMLDLGGGAGLNCVAIVDAHPSMKGTVFDFPEVAEKARDYIRDYGMENRITTLGGDYTLDDLGSGYDLIWASGTLNFNKDSLEQVMAKICDALSPGGIFISLHDVLSPDGTGPGVSVFRFLPMALAGTDFYLEADRLANTMARAGLKPVDSRSIETPFGPVQLDIGRVPANPV